MASPLRKRMLVKKKAGKVWLSDRADLSVEIELENFVEQFLALQNQGIAVRPKALMTTMFARLVLSDLFVHGIGGAKYDQLTDVICQRFFQLKPPGFITLSATMKLPHQFEFYTKTDLMKGKQLSRELVYHPEKFLGEQLPTQELVKEKADWTHGERSLEKNHERHVAISEINKRLLALIKNPEKTPLISNENIRTGEVLDSREHSFALFPYELVSELDGLLG